MELKKWFTSPFEDYELIDAGGGKKLERWGAIYTIRPEVQAYFKSGMSFASWENYNPLHFEEKGKQSGFWSKNQPPWNIHFGSLQFLLETTKFKHLGLFPEQEINWQYIQNHLQAGDKFLNLFAYTGAASIVAREREAIITHVDSVKQLISWAKNNMEANHLQDIKWVHEDALKFAEREVKRGNTYKGVLMDPPAWGIGAKGEKWKIENKLESLLETAYNLLDEGGFLILNTYSPRVSLEDMIQFASRYFSPSGLEAGELWAKTTTGKELFYGHLLRATK